MFRPISDTFRGLHITDCCNLNEFSIANRFFCLTGLAGGSIIENLTLNNCFQKIFFLYWNIMVTCDFFLQLRNLFLSYAELNRLWVGWRLIPLNIKLQQDDRTVCCGDKIVLSFCSLLRYRLNVFLPPTSRSRMSKMFFSPSKFRPN